VPRFLGDLGISYVFGPFFSGLNHAGQWSWVCTKWQGAEHRPMCFEVVGWNPWTLNALWGSLFLCDCSALVI
jgi:hypothetical protein